MFEFWQQKEILLLIYSLGSQIISKWDRMYESSPLSVCSIMNKIKIVRHMAASCVIVGIEP